jgi:heme/copper-type cytochrome/quinol oxidase subunit 3
VDIYPFALPFSNLFILLFSSLPLQSTLIFIKTGLKVKTLEGLGQNIACGFLFIVLQFKEYIYAYFSISDSIYGSIFYFTTGLHGFHVFIGSVCSFSLFFFFNPIPLIQQLPSRHLHGKVILSPRYWFDWSNSSFSQFLYFFSFFFHRGFIINLSLKEFHQPYQL